MKKLIPLLFPLLVAVIGVGLILNLYPLAHPFGGIRLPLDREAITARAQQLLDSLGADVNGLVVDVDFKADRSLVRYLQHEYGIDGANEKIRNGFPAYYWDVSWRSSQAKQIGIIQVNEDDDTEARPPQVYDATVKLGLDGRLLGFQRDIPDTVPLPIADALQARERAEQFLIPHTPFVPGPAPPKAPSMPIPPAPVINDSGSIAGEDGPAPNIAFENEKRNEQKSRTDHEFNWTTSSPDADNKVRVTVVTAGDLISRFKVEYILPKDETKDSLDSIHGISVVVIYVALIIMMIVVAFKRIRAFEIGFKAAIFIGLIVAVAFAIEIAVELSREAGWDLLAAVLIGPLFYGGAIVLLWAIGESLTREAWNEKMITVDLLRNGYFVHSRIGSSIIRGIASGISALALWLFFSWLAGAITHTWIGHNDNATPAALSTESATFMVLSRSLYTKAFLFTCFVLLLVPFVRRRFQSPILIIALPAIVFGLTNPGGLYPLPIGMLVEAASISLVMLAYYRYDVLAGFLALFTFGAISEASMLVLSGNPTTVTSGMILYGVFGLLVIVSMAMQFRKREVEDFDEITPAVARIINDRQRMQQELEIAREVQMSFLPTRQPEISLLEIASRCVPAKEVGGDYYDFIEIDNNTVGVAIGDVSGKGTQAAFFMTLVKGFLRAHVKVSVSPSKVLADVNRLFSENVKKGIFISMVYAVFDMKKCTLTVARAGHNPLLVRKSSEGTTRLLVQSGLALGLDPGDMFARSIQEVNVPLEPGDVFVLYTDGFTEAMNKKQEEFGEERLSHVIERYAGATAEEILEAIFRETKSFVGNAPQHDDMTAVVVKMRKN